MYFSIDYFLSKMSSLRYPVGSILQLLGRLLGRMVSRHYFKCCSLTMKQVRKLCMTGKRRRFICIVGVTRSGTMTRSRWWLRLGFFGKNAFDYFIKIRNFENEKIQFLYPNTILKMKKFNFLSKHIILKMKEFKLKHLKFSRFKIL